MGAAGTLQDHVDALIHGRASVDRSDHRLFEIEGADAATWLNDLLTAGLDHLRPGDETPSLLLDATGHIRAHLAVIRTDRSFVLVQDPIQGEEAGALLAPYVLSSDVRIIDRTGVFAIFSTPAGAVPSNAGWIAGPSSVAAVDAAVPRADVPAVRERLGLTLVPAEAVEAWRILRGIPRFGIDLADDSIPAEVGWESMIDTSKGCFLGQESVARVRLGRPPHRIVHLRSGERLDVGDPLLRDGREAGRATSVWHDEDGTTLIARVRVGDGPLGTASGRPLEEAVPIPAVGPPG